jgi:hypothetical protein
MNKFGSNGDVDGGSVPEDVMDMASVVAGRTVYIFSTGNDIDRLSSANNGDTQDVEVQGCRVDGTLVTQTVTLTGQTPVAIPTPLYRVWRLTNIGATDNAGVVYCFENVAVTLGVPNNVNLIRAIINIGINQTLMAVYTIPGDFTGFIEKVYVSCGEAAGNATEIEAALLVRPPGQVFQTKHVMAATNQSSPSVKEYLIPDPILRLSDVLIRVRATSANDTVVHAGFDVVLVENSP